MMKDIFGVKVVRQTKVHILKTQVPEGQWIYSIRNADFKDKAATIEKEVFINFRKYIITNGPIEWIERDPKNNYIQINNDGSFTAERNLVLK
jgi:hypothetical protein